MDKDSMLMETVILYNGKVFVGLVEGSDEGERNYGIIFIFLKMSIFPLHFGGIFFVEYKVMG